MEFYFILFIISSISTFFACSWIFKKFIKANKVRKVVTWATTLVLTFFIYCGLISLWLMSISYYPTYAFNKEKWLANKEKRYELSEDIIVSRMLLGKTKAEVRQILGDEGNGVKGNNWNYYLGFVPGLASIDPDVLDIEFKVGKVIKVGQHEN
jgi:hypothetical protein